ncbi:hypothetical protein BDP55DRAFT_682316 [Colletotrichum godetiae]|uniref:Uncharacterized protein n=1 Tax=Colletotrichum godetiae TaxID=1209918 RepID=A0AAJ0ABF2_9PEZI|nr:uncharacterized protein BDP55DRAFT_682316 [Colletotrichum godetiae]KAK1658511.1 hypothetical protein BDP55DRAFT_682316 [Colletotrichum godetiae]
MTPPLILWRVLRSLPSGTTLASLTRIEAKLSQNAGLAEGIQTSTAETSHGKRKRTCPASELPQRQRNFKDGTLSQEGLYPRISHVLGHILKCQEWLKQIVLRNRS